MEGRLVENVSVLMASLGGYEEMKGGRRVERSSEPEIAENVTLSARWISRTERCPKVVPISMTMK